MDDELLRALGRTQRRGAPSPPPMPDAPPSPSPAPELLAPFDTAERDALLDAVFAKVDGDAATPEVTPIVAAKRSHARSLGLVAIAVAIAAALVLWVARPSDTGAALPSYALTELRGGAATVRAEPGDTDRELLLARGERIELTLTPAQPTTAPLVVDLVARSPGHADVTARVPAQVTASGAVRLAGPLDDFIALEPGAWQLWVVLSPAAAAPRDAIAALEQSNVRKVGFRVKLAAPE